MSEIAETGNVGLAVKLSKAYGALKRYRLAAETASKDKETLEKQVEKLTAENDQLKTSTDAKRIAELSGELRTIKHKDVFRKLAEKAGVRPEGLDDLYSLSGYKAELDVPDEAGMTKLIEAQKQARSYLFVEAKADDTTEATEEPKPGPASGQGGVVKTGPKFTEQQMNDPVFIMKNQEAIAAHARERLAAGQI